MTYWRFLSWLTVAGVMLVSPVVIGDVVFEADFNDQPDWTSTMHSTSPAQQVSTGHTLPTGWDSIYQGTAWSPETGFPNNHASLEILASNTDKARGGTGKSMVHWRESNSFGDGNNYWASDSQTVKVLDRQHNRLYVEFWIAFSDNFEGRTGDAGWISKIFRVGSWNGEGSIFNGALGTIGPVFFWDYVRSIYGNMNVHSYRGGPWGENYYMTSSEPTYPADTYRNFGSFTKGQAPGDTDPLLVDQVNGGYLHDIDRYTPITHEQVYGTGQHWTKVAFYFQINSAPDATDGVLKQWINDRRVVNLTNIPWIKANADNKMVGWNYIAMGGNDFFRPYPDTDRFEDWYAIDDVVIMDEIPSGLVEANAFAPQPPSGLVVQ
jgi:hypothetical protein